MHYLAVIYAGADDLRPGPFYTSPPTLKRGKSDGRFTA